MFCLMIWQLIYLFGFSYLLWYSVAMFYVCCAMWWFTHRADDLRLRSCRGSDPWTVTVGIRAEFNTRPTEDITTNSMTSDHEKKESSEDNLELGDFR